MDAHLWGHMPRFHCLVLLWNLCKSLVLPKARRHGEGYHGMHSERQNSIAHFNGYWHCSPPANFLSYTNGSAINTIKPFYKQMTVLINLPWPWHHDHIAFQARRIYKVGSRTDNTKQSFVLILYSNTLHPCKYYKGWPSFPSNTTRDVIDPPSLLILHGMTLLLC